MCALPRWHAFRFLFIQILDHLDGMGIAFVATIVHAYFFVFDILTNIAYNFAAHVFYYIL